MKDLIILGAGVHALEMAEIAGRVRAAGGPWNLLGYIVPMPEAHAVGQRRNGYPVLDVSGNASRYAGAHFALAFGFPRDDIPVPRERLVPLIDPSCFVSRTAVIGPGCVLFPGCFVGLNAVLRDRVFVLSGATINHDDVLEESVCVCSGVTLAGYVQVERECYLGQACTVKQGLRIGARSLVGMGAVVTRDVAPGRVVAGNPARAIGETPQQGDVTDR